MASMIGIGVAIDYSLFILARYREEREAGRGKREARAQALSTSGLAVTFSGPGGDHLPRRALDGRQPGAALDGAGGDDRGRGLDPDRDDAAAGADRDARRPRPAGRDRRPGRALLQAPRLPPPGRAPATPSARRRQPLLGGLDPAGDGAAVDRGDRRLGGAAVPRHPAALARDRDRGARPVPQGQRRPGRQRTRLATARRRHRPDPDRRRLPAARRPRRPRRRRRLRPPRRRHARGQRGGAAGLRRRQRPDPGDAERAERVRRGRGAGRAACATASSPPRP